MPGPRMSFVVAFTLLVLSLRLGGVEARAQGGDSPDTDWGFIERLLADGMADVAAGELEAFARNHTDDPRGPEALRRAGAIYEELGQTVSALAAYDELLRRYASSAEAPTALLRKGEILSAAERHGEAAEAYRALLESHPASEAGDAARLGLAEALLALGQQEAARPLLQRLVSGRAEPALAARALYNLGLVAQRAGADSLALARFDRIHRQYPDEPIGAFGLLRGAEAMLEQEAPLAARQRYEAVLQGYAQPFLLARAHLGLAGLDEASGAAAEAAEHYRAVAEEGGSAAQLEEALLGLARSELDAGRLDEAEAAAGAYLTHFERGPRAGQARLLRARVLLERDREDAPDSLRVLGENLGGTVALEAFSLLAERAREDGELGEAAALWRRASRAAPPGDVRARALLSEARLVDEALQRPALAADLARQAVDTAQEPTLRAQALLLGLRAEERAGRRGEALRLGDTLTSEYPLTPQAAEGRAEMRRLRRRMDRRPEEAARSLAELAMEEGLEPTERALRAGLLLRDVLGDGEASLAAFERAARAAGTPGERARAALESARALEAMALEAALDGTEEPARRLLGRARSSYADAAAQAGGGEASARARVGLLRLELSMAALPQTPWLVDADAAPLLGGVGELEAVPLDAPAFVALERRIDDALAEEPTGDEAAWLLWRKAELAGGEEPATRRAWVERALEDDPSPSRRMQLRYTRAQLLLLEEKGEEAARELSRLLERQPHDELGLAARYGLAELHRAARRYRPAGQLYAEFASAFPRSQRGQRALLLAGDCALFGGEPEQAAARYRDLLARYPGSVYEDDAHYRLGTALQRMGRAEAARGHFLRLSRWEGGSDYGGRSLLKLAQLDRAAGHDSLAVDSFRELERVDPTLAAQPEVALEFAELLLGRSDAEGALRRLDTLEASVEPTVASLALRVRAYAAAGRWSDAVATLDRLSRGWPQEVEAVVSTRLDLAEALDAAGRGGAAAEQFEAAASEAPDAVLKARAAYGAGLVAARAGRMEEALQGFERARDLAPSSEWGAQALFKIGGIRSHAGDHEAARRAFGRLVEEHPHHELAPEALRGEAGSWRRLGRYDKALESYHRLLEDYPELEDGEQILAHIAYCHHEMGQYEVAIGAYERVLPLLEEEEQAYAQFWVADSLEKLERFEEAAAAYLRIPYLYPRSGQLPVTAQLKAAGVYERMGRVDAARRLYEKVVAQHGAASQWGAEAVKRLERLPEDDRGGS